MRVALVTIRNQVELRSIRCSIVSRHNVVRICRCAELESGDSSCGEYGHTLCSGSKPVDDELRDVSVLPHVDLISTLYHN